MPTKRLLVALAAFGILFPVGTAYAATVVALVSYRIQSSLRSVMGVRDVMLPNTMLRDKPLQGDGMHLTAQGYHALAQKLVRPVAGALRK